jgi:hypothetical protein
MRLPIKYSAAELAWLRDNCTLPIGDRHAQFNAKFGRDVGKENIRALCKRNGWLTGRTGHYAKGHAPDNAGKKMPFNANSAACRFKKGDVPVNKKSPGHERLDENGYVLVNVDEVNPWNGHASRYVHKHVWMWRQANGPVPEGMALKCMDGDRTNCDPGNWEPIERGLLPMLTRRYHFDDAPEELRPVILTAAKIQRRLRKIGSM